MTYLEFFNLKEDPFGLSPDSAYFYPSKIHSDVLASLDYGIDQKEGFSLVIGEPGTGKTTLLKIFINHWKDRAEIALILTPRLSAGELLQAVLEDLKIRLQSSNKNELITAFRDFLIERSHAGKRVMIIVDEAQNLSDDALEELRLLSNLETEKEKLLQIVLVGQPELLARLQTEPLRQLHQRITVKATLRPLTPEEVSDYISFRLIKAGTGFALIGDGVKKDIYKRSGGMPRLINLISSRAMMAAYIDSVHQVRKHHVRSAVEHLLIEQPDRVKRSMRIGTLVTLVGGAILVTVLLLASYQLGRHDKEIKGSPSTSLQTPSVASAGAPMNTLRKAVALVDEANLRQRPSLTADIVKVSRRGDQLVLLGEWTEQNGNRWYNARTVDGKEGWIAAPIVKLGSIP